MAGASCFSTFETANEKKAKITKARPRFDPQGGSGCGFGVLQYNNLGVQYARRALHACKRGQRVVTLKGCAGCQPPPGGNGVVFPFQDQRQSLDTAFPFTYDQLQNNNESEGRMANKR